jgi:hypothetical protein
MSREAMQMALDALESNPATHAGLISRKQAIAALRQALVDADDMSQKRVDGTVKCKHEWVGLTDDVVFELADTNLYEGGKNFGVLAFAKAIEQALKEKNT